MEDGAQRRASIAPRAKEASTVSMELLKVTGGQSDVTNSDDDLHFCIMENFQGVVMVEKLAISENFPTSRRVQ